MKNRRFLLTLAALMIVSGYFWTQSRYPQLDHKAMMGAETHIEALGFDALLTAPENSSLWLRIYVNSVNWMYTNAKEWPSA